MESPWLFKKRVRPQEGEGHQPSIIPVTTAGEKEEKTKKEVKNTKQTRKERATDNERRQKEGKKVEKDIRILYANADQLTPGKIAELYVHKQNEKPHIIAVCEVKTKAGELKHLHEYEHHEYSLVNQTNVDTIGGRGIIILAHNSIKHLIVKISPVEFDEACIIEVRLADRDLLAFACLYRSPTRTRSSDKNNAMLNLLIKTISKDKKYSHKCFIGDFNFPTINWENWTTPHIEESKEEKFLEAIRDSFLLQHVDEPTRCRGSDDPSLIDLIFTSEENQIRDLQYLSPLGKSDHNVLTFTFACYTERKVNSKRYVFEEGDYTAMKQFIVANDWSEALLRSMEEKSVEESWRVFKDNILDLRTQFVPLKESDCQSWRTKGSIPIGKDLQKK